MSTLAQLLADEQARRGVTDYRAASDIGVSQQSYSSWKSGAVPRLNKHAAIAEWLGVSPESIVDSTETVSDASSGTFGVVSDRKTGKYRFAGEFRFPQSRYAVPIDTNVMEPALLYGTRVWLDPSVWPHPGHEVVAHGPKGLAWLGRLVEINGNTATISNTFGEIVVRDLQAVHVVVLAERVAGTGEIPTK